MRIVYLLFLTLLILPFSSTACSVLYYVDSLSGKVYVVNNEDYFYDVKPYIQIEPAKRSDLARLWYGWDDFAQGGINEAGFFFDGAVVPKEGEVEGYEPAKYNLGDRLLARCKTVDEALAYLEEEKIAYPDSHLMFGDSSGNAVVVEWINGEQHLIRIMDDYLMMTNFNLAKPTHCPRYEAMQAEIDRLEENGTSIDLRTIGNIGAKAVQLAATDEQGREGGTLYSSFINITDLEFVLVYKYDNNRRVQLDLNQEFARGKKKKLWLEKL